MNGYLARLTARAAGLAPGATVEPLPAIYHGPSESVWEGPFELDIPAAPRQAQPQIEPLPRPPASPASVADGVSMTRAGDPASPLPVPGAPHTSAQPPPRAAPPLPRPSPSPLAGAPRSEVVARAKRALPATPRPSADPAALPHRKTASDSGAVTPEPAAAQAVPRTSIERIFAALDSPPAAPASPRLREPPSPAGHSIVETAAPSVTIGRIEIIVAPPQPSTPAPDPRTRGFGDYARLRRGLAR